MTQEEKVALLRDLCVRLSYGVKCDINGELCEVVWIEADRMCVYLRKEDGHSGTYSIARGDSPKPYLRPVSGMTDGEKEELKELTGGIIQCNNYGSVSATVCRNGYPHYWCTELGDWVKVADFLLRRHFDVFGLIGKGLAMEAPEGMY